MNSVGHSYISYHYHLLQREKETGVGKGAKVVGGAGVAPPYERKMKRKKKALPVDLMNHFLATRFALNPKKVERRTCEEMFTDFSLQKIGVGGKRAKNAKTLENLRTESPITDETLAAMLANYEKEDLLEVAEGKGLEILPGRRLQDIAAEVADYMLDEKVLKAVLYVLADEEMEALKTLLKGKLPRLDENPFHILYITAYVSENMNGDPQIAMDVAEKVRKVLPYINDDERRRRAWFYASLQTAGGLYVNFPINVLSDYMERGGYRPMTLKEIKALFEKIPLETRCGKVGHNGKFWCDLFEIEEWDALIPLDKKPYYIPTKEEIREGAFSPIFAPNFYEEELVSFFQDILGFGTEEAHQLWTKLSWVFFSGCDVNFALEILQEEGYTERLPKNKEGDLRHILARIQGQTRALTLKGFTPGEISRRREKEREDRAIARGRVPQKVISLQERQKMKQKRIQARKGNIE